MREGDRETPRVRQSAVSQTQKQQEKIGAAERKGKSPEAKHK